LVSMVNDGFKNMNNRFDQLDKKFEDLDNLIGESAFYIKLNSYSLDLINVKTKVAFYFEENNQTVKEINKLDINEELWTKGYDALISLKAYFEGELGHSQSICKMVTDFTDNHRLKTMHTSLQIYNRMVRGARDLVLIKGTLAGSYGAEVIKDRMVKWLREVAEKIDECDEDIRKNKWLAQWKKDISTILTNTKHSSSNQCPLSHPWAYLNGGYCCQHDREKIDINKDGTRCDGSTISLTSSCCKNDAFTACPHNGGCVNHVNTRLPDVLKTFLTSKYDWRDWFLVLFRRRGGDEKQYISNPCHGGQYTYINNNWNGWTIYVSSVKKTSSYKNINTGIPSNFRNSDANNNMLSAKKMYEYLRPKVYPSCTVGFMAGIIAKEGGDIVVDAPEKRKHFLSFKFSQLIEIRWPDFITREWEEMDFQAFLVA